MNVDLIIDILIRTGFALLFIVVVMVTGLYSVLAERKVASWIQRRVGPNRTTLPVIGSIPVLGRMLTRLGLFQPIADGMKFLLKEEPFPGHVNKFYYTIAPVLVMTPALLTLSVIPMGSYINAAGEKVPFILANVDVGLLLLFAMASLGAYGAIMAGWASNNKYSLMGGVRASAQMISYELALSLSALSVFVWVSTPGSGVSGLSLVNIVEAQQNYWFILVQPLTAFLFLICLFAETNRLPFDMPESETDLVSGFFTEYGCFKFGLFFITEYSHMVIAGLLFSLVFLGGWNFLPGLPTPWADWGIWGGLIGMCWLCAKALFLVFFFIWVRWTIPRFRYDQVMRLGWKGLLPLALVNFVFNIILIGAIDKYFK